MNDPYLTHLRAHDGADAASFGWPEDCTAPFELGVQRAEDWLNDHTSSWLWVDLFIERELFPRGARRHAFEVGFMSRIHQRLCSPRGGNHGASQALLRL